MTAASDRRGAAPVGYLEDLGAVEAGAVMYFRLWAEGSEAQAQVWAEFADALGPTGGREALGALEQLVSLCARHARRPILRHGVACKCIGGDEACFANFIAAAAGGEREDAMLIATLLVRPDVAPLLVGLAERLGLALRRMAGVRRAPPLSHRPEGATLH